MENILIRVKSVEVAFRVLGGKERCWCKQIQDQRQ